MVTRPDLELEERRGIVGDCQARPLGPRQVLIVRQEALDELGVDARRLRANIVLAGLPEALLASGRVVRFTSGAQVRLTHACEICSVLRGHVDRDTFRALAGRRGVLGVVALGGAVALHDEVVIDPNPAFPLVPDTVGERVQWVVRRVPAGRVITYAKVIELVGGRHAHFRALPTYIRRAEAAGLKAHRILNSAGGLTGHVPDQGPRLAQEGVALTDRGTVADPRRLWTGEELYLTAA